MMVQLLTVYANNEHYNAQCYRWMDRWLYDTM